MAENKSVTKCLEHLPPENLFFFQYGWFLSVYIKFEETYTLPSWRKRYNLIKGSTHGLSHTLTQLAYFRPSNRHPRYQNLYFVGASTHPGTVVLTAMGSGRLVAERIKEELYG